jgi:hypothetical protein
LIVSFDCTLSFEKSSSNAPEDTELQPVIKVIPDILDDMVDLDLIEPIFDADAEMTDNASLTDLEATVQGETTSGCVTSIIKRCGTCSDPSSVTSAGGGGGGRRPFLLENDPFRSPSIFGRLLLGFLPRRGDLFVKASSSSEELSSSELVFRRSDRFLVLEPTLVPFLFRPFEWLLVIPKRPFLPELRERGVDRGDDLPTGETTVSNMSSSDFDLGLANPVNPATSMSVSTKSSSSNSFPRLFRFSFSICILTLLASCISFSFCFRARAAAL